MSGFNQIDCVVALLDILGFKEIVDQNDLALLMRIYENAFLSSLQFAAAGGAAREVATPSGKVVSADLSNAKVQCLVISDSVVLWNTAEK